MANTIIITSRNIGNTATTASANPSSNRGLAVQAINLTQLHNSVGINAAADASFVTVNKTIIQNGLSTVTLGGQGSTFYIKDPSVRIEFKYDETMSGWFVRNNSSKSGFEIMLSGNEDQVIAEEASVGKWAPIDRGDIINLAAQRITFDLLPARSGGEMLERVLVRDKRTQVGYSVRSGDADHTGDDYVYVGGQVLVGGKSYQVYGIFDGISQYGKGRYSSKEAAEYIDEFIHSDQAKNIAKPEELLNDAFVYAHNKLKVKQYDSGTTAVVLLVDEAGKTAYVAHVGDSRLYAVKKDGTVECQTIDHTGRKDAERKTSGTDQELIRNLPKGIWDALTRALGHRSEEPKPMPEIKMIKLEGLAGFVLCSDGVDEKAVNGADFKSKDPHEIAKSLTARQGAKFDDASAMVVKLNPQSR
ncbi:MAG: PP2C family protein-serine/threonine phosphatase [Candidatus Margulisiibacteriota bacterium]